ISKLCHKLALACKITCRTPPNVNSTSQQDSPTSLAGRRSIASRLRPLHNSPDVTGGLSEQSARSTPRAPSGERKHRSADVDPLLQGISESYSSSSSPRR
ncbi:hypothetical protein BD626DRAFT_522135, partial [Schizophyllum amplum]